MSDDSPQESKLEGILKKAVSIGTGVYMLGEDTVQKTLQGIQIPKEWLKESIEAVFDAYTISIQAEIKLSPKKKKEALSKGENSNE